MEVSDSSGLGWDPEMYLFQGVTLLSLRIRDVWETFATVSKKFFIPNELYHFNVSVVPFKQVQTLIPIHDLLCSFRII